MTELKPCPFCGSSACITKVSESHGMDGHYYDWLIRCKCGVSLRRAADNFYGRKAYTKEEAIAAWNRRADGWRDAKTDPPNDHGYYIVYTDTYGVILAAYNPDANDGWCKWYSVDMYDSYDINDIHDVTHWMPRPEPPGKEV